MIHPCKPHNLVAIICLSMLIVFAAGNVWAEDSDAKNPLSLWKGQGGSYLKLTFSSEIAYFDQNNSWFGEDRDNLGDKSDDWWEATIRPGIEGSYFFDAAGEAYGRFDAVQANTQDIDGAGSNVGLGDVSKIRVEEAYAGWRSGNLFSSLGKDFLDISFGRQQYIVGTGFLFYSESGNGGERGAFWIGDRHAAQYAGIVRMKTGGWTGDAVYFRADDNPDTDTKVGGANLEYAFDKVGNVGAAYYRINSDIDSRDDMNLYNVRGTLTPFEVFGDIDFLKPLTLEGEFAYEDLDDSSNDTGDSGVGWYIQPSYQLAVTWKPRLTYRYASFDKDFDPLFYGFNDWGTWYQGEILGEYVLANSNLNSHMVKLDVQPTDSLHLNLFYYNFTIDDADSFGTDSDDYADEVDFIVDYTFNDHLNFSLLAAYATPDDAAEESTGGNDDWWYSMFYTKISF